MFRHLLCAVNLLSWLSGENHCAAVRMACVAVGPRRSGVQIRAWRLVGSCRSSSAYSENNISGRHRGFDGVLINLGPFANVGYRDAQLLNATWTTDNRWRPAACAGRSLMALFTRAAKLDLGAHGTRYARTKAVHHAVGISRQRNWL